MKGPTVDRGAETGAAGLSASKANEGDGVQTLDPPRISKFRVVEVNIDQSHGLGIAWPDAYYGCRRVGSRGLL